MAVGEGPWCLDLRAVVRLPGEEAGIGGVGRMPRLYLPLLEEVGVGEEVAISREGIGISMRGTGIEKGIGIGTGTGVDLQ